MNFFNYVQDAQLSPPRRPYTKRVRTDRIIFHMVGGTMSVQAIHEMHKADPTHGYTGIAYNIYIDKDGTAYWGRGLEYVGGATKTKLGLNPTSIHVVCNGDFDKEKMSAAQKKTLFQLTVELVQYYHFSSVSALLGHGDVDDTSCPGKNFPMAALKEYIRTYGQPVQGPVSTPPVEETQLLGIHKILSDETEICEDVKVLQRALRDKRVYIGKIDGDFGPKTKAAVITFQKLRRLKPVDGIVGPVTAKALGLAWLG